jgi:DNA-binding beta-propeller fold protein YncE
MHLHFNRLTHLIALCGAVSLFGVACSNETGGISPPDDAFYFPTALALDPKRPVLYLANSNADLRYNGGTLMALDLSLLPDDLSQVKQRVADNSLDCSPDRVDITSWECKSGEFINENATVRIGAFPSALAISPDGKRIFAPLRGDNHLAYFDIADLANGQVDLRCHDTDCANAGSDNCAQWDCDSNHRVSFSSYLGQSLPDEPFGMVVNQQVAVHVDDTGRRQTCRDGVSQVSCDCAGTALCSEKLDGRSCCIPAAEGVHIYVAHLSGGEVSFFNAIPDGEVRLEDFRAGLFDTASSLKGGFALAPSLPGDPRSPIYVSSRTDNTLSSFVVQENQFIVLGRRTAIQAASPGQDIRGIAFSPGGETLYAISRDPAALVALDMAPESDGIPRQRPLWVVEVCAEPSTLVMGSHPQFPNEPKAQLAYVVCFAESAINVVDTVSAQLVSRIRTGAGPNQLVLDEAHKRAFVTNFIDNTIGVIDLDPQNATFRRMVLRIGLQENLVKDN